MSKYNKKIWNGIYGKQYTSKDIHTKKEKVCFVVALIYQRVLSDPDTLLADVKHRTKENKSLRSITIMNLYVPNIAAK